MAREIERKFLVKDASYKELATGVLYRQGYLNSARERTVRVRVAGERAFLTIKGPNVCAACAEYEYEIPLLDAEAILDALAEKPLVEKMRYKIAHGGFVWEVDEFLGDNHGLVVAEIELESATQQFGRPDWAGEEVTGDPKYFNSSLVKNPFGKWRKP